MTLPHTISVLALTSCTGRHALDQVPIEGGTAEQRAAIEAELARFEQWVGVDRVELAGIKVSQSAESWQKDHSARYGRLTARIELSGELDPADVPMTLRHELCHALDAQEDLLAHAEPAFDLAASRAERDDAHPLHDSLGTGRRTQRAEVFAYVCQQAPLGTALLSRPCPGESTEYAEVAGWVADRAWTGTPDVSRELLWSLSPSTGPWAVPFEADELIAMGSQSRDAVLLFAVSDDLEQEGTVSTVDGSEVPFIEDLALDDIRDGFEAEAPHRAPDLGFFHPSVLEPIDVVSDGEITLRIIRGLYQPDLKVLSAPHVLVGPFDHTWSVVEGACPGQASSVFVANGQLHLAWAEASFVWWSQPQ